MRIALTILLSLCTISAWTQGLSWSDVVDALEDDEYAEEQGWLDQLEELQTLHDNPIDINTATPQQLLQLPFLNEQQVDDIERYILYHRGMRSLSELMAIPSIDYNTRQYLGLFLCADEGIFNYNDSLTWKNLIRQSHHELTSRLDIPLYYRAGYSYSPSQGGYRGNPLYNRIQYRMTSMKHLSIGLQAEKDAGEPFRHNRGWDAYGFHVSLQNIGHLKTLVAGDYKLGFGEGLVMNCGFSGGKSMLMISPSHGLRAKTSMDENNFLRGVASTMQWGHVQTSLWTSRRKWDGTPSDDNGIQTITTTGLHRTNTELVRKDILHATEVGGNISWENNGFHLGTTGYFLNLDKSLQLGDEAYRRYYPEGKRFGIVGTDYGYHNNWFSFRGETAWSSEKNGIATLNRLTWRASSRYSLTTVQRYYSRKYYSFHAAAISETYRVQNETGGLIRLDAQPIDGLSLVAMTDVFYNPWVRYGMKHSSLGEEFSLSAEYQVNKKNTIYARYQLKRKEQSNVMQEHHRLRLKWTYQPNNQWRSQTQATLHFVGSKGFALSESVRYTSKNDQWKVQAMASWFHTKDFDSRVYIYEPSLLNTFALPSLYGHGLRWVSTVRWTHPSGHWMLEARYGGTRYLDRETQSSGMQEIFSPWKNDLQVQVRIKI